jgi:hypothetical protein
MRRIAFTALALLFITCATGGNSSSMGVPTTATQVNSETGHAAAAHSRAPAFSSAYTDLNKECKDALKEVGEGQDMPLKCKGYGGYHIYIYYSAWASHINADMDKDENVSISLASQSLSYSDEKGRKIEWRMADGKPFAVILRISNYNTEKANVTGDNPFDDKYKTGESLIVKGLKGYEHIDATVDAKTPDANARAREIADSGYAKK